MAELLSVARLEHMFRPATIGLLVVAIVASLVRMVPSDWLPPQGPDPSACSAVTSESPDMDRIGEPGQRFIHAPTMSAVAVDFGCTGSGGPKYRIP
jgi:hypothetical protein